MSDDDREKRPTNELAAYLRALWARKSWIAAGTVLCFVVAAALVAIETRQYRATARLAISGFHVGDVDLAEPNMATYASLIRSQTIAQQLVQQHGLAEAPFELTALHLLDRVSVRRLPDTSIVELSVLLPDAQAAMEICNQFAISAEELTRAVNQTEFGLAQRVLSSELAAVDALVEEAERELAGLGGEAAIHTLERELDVYLDRREDLETRWLDLVLLAREQEVNPLENRIGDLEETRLAIVTERMPEMLQSRLAGTLESWNELQKQLAEVEVALEGERATLVQLEAELAEKEPTMVLQRTLDDEALVAAARRRDDNQSVPLRLSSEYVSPVYESIEESIVLGRATVSGLDQQRLELQAQLEAHAARAEALEAQLASTMHSLDALDRRLELAKEEYADLYSRAPEGVSAALTVVETQLAETTASIVETQAELASRDAHVQRVAAQYESALELRADLAWQLEQSEINVAGEIAELSIIDPPILPSEAASPRVMLRLVGAIFVGFLVSLLIATIAAALEATAVEST